MFAKLKTQGFQESTIYEAMRRIAGNRATPHASKTGDFLKQLGEQFDPDDKPEMKVGSIVRYYKILTYVFAAAALAYLLPDLIRHYFP